MGYDDSRWAVASVLTADDYGFHTGDVWYRGHFQGAVPDQGMSPTTW
ncbi:beta galactosidase jelly roll domain-containing protein [Kibdelosporangium lantanae]|uniref:Beta galactosidase jelly roll domain-containing protein n=1 Tax=Kibdelosporangium lantanae TaxID=1497396 RepID=A0ABW3M6Y7_9PSEU